MTWGWRSSRTVVISAAAAVFILVCALPTAYMLWAVGSAPEPLAAVRGAILDDRQRRLLATTLMLGFGTAGLATLIGVVLGFVLARITTPFKAAVRIALVSPVVLPPYVVAFAWTYIAGSAAFSLVGAILVLTVAFYPLSMLATEVGLRLIDPRLEEAALLVAAPRRVLRRISWPLVLPHVMAAALVIFVLAISEFSVPGLLRVRVFTTEVFSAFAALYDFARATVLSLPLLLISLIVAVSAATGFGNRLIATSRPLRAATGDAFAGWRFAGIAAVVAGILLMVVVPLAALASEASRTTALLAEVWGSRDAVINSLVLATVAATAITILAAVLGYARAAATATVGAALDALWLILFTVPSTVVGIGLVGVWNRAGVWAAVYGTPVMLVIAALARFVPVGALAIAALVRTVPASHEEAAAVAGARWLRTFARIVVPQIRLGLAAVWVIAFVLAFGEVGASILVAPPGESTLPIRVYTMTANAPPGRVAALALFQSLVVLCPLAWLGMAFAQRDAG